MQLGKYSFGIGDRFARQGEALLAAIIKAEQAGVLITPVWNKSFREHQTIKSQPADTRREADQAVQALRWQHDYFVDADHVGLKNIDFFMDYSDFFTLDVADFIGQAADADSISAFVAANERYIGKLKIPAIDQEFEVSREQVVKIAAKFLYAVQEAGRVYRHILSKKEEGSFVVEVSMDETDEPQSPIELLFILAAIAGEGIPARTIAPKFTGRFNKGVDYVGDLAQFTREFEQDLAVLDFAVAEFSLPSGLKLSVHSGSDKFSIYGPIKNALKKFDAGVHIKTAGTTWLEEIIGLAMAGGDGLALAKEIYRKALERYDELAKPYATVIDIHRDELPDPDVVDTWDEETFANTLRHDQSCDQYNPSFRQLLHVAYKIAAEMGDDYLRALEKHREIVARNVTENIFERHIKRLFL